MKKSLRKNQTKSIEITPKSSKLGEKSKSKYFFKFVFGVVIFSTFVTDPGNHLSRDLCTMVSASGNRKRQSTGQWYTCKKLQLLEHVATLAQHKSGIKIEPTTSSQCEPLFRKDIRSQRVPRP